MKKNRLKHLIFVNFEELKLEENQNTDIPPTASSNNGPNNCAKFELKDYLDLDSYEVLSPSSVFGMSFYSFTEPDARSKVKIFDASDKYI